MNQRSLAAKLLDEWVPWNPIYLVVVGIIAFTGIFFAQGSGLQTVF